MKTKWKSLNIDAFRKLSQAPFWNVVCFWLFWNIVGFLTILKHCVFLTILKHWNIQCLFDHFDTLEHFWSFRNVVFFMRSVFSSCPQTNNPHEWIQVDFLSMKRLTGVITQGARAMLTHMMVTKFIVTISDDGHTWFSVTEKGTTREKVEWPLTSDKHTDQSESSDNRTAQSDISDNRTDQSD